jgi:thioredoxin-like negative regulator of GroEL
MAILTNGDPDEVAELARELEHFRSIVMILTGVARLADQVPFRIIAVAGRGDFKEIFSQFNAVGVFSPSLLGHYAVIDLSARSISASGRPVKGAAVYLKHEYVHFILRGGSSVVYPYWYEEGFAEYLSTLEYEDGSVRVGFPVVMRQVSLTRDLGLAGVENLLRSTRHNRTINTELLYAQGWQLVHYLHMNPETAPKIVDYLKRYGETGDSVAAFKETFGLDLSSLHRDLSKTAERGRYNYATVSLKQPLPIPQVTVRPLSSVAARLEIAEVLTHFRSDDKDFEDVAEIYRDIQASEPGNPDIAIGLAELALRQGDPRGAAAAMASLPDDVSGNQVLVQRAKVTFALAMAEASGRAHADAQAVEQARQQLFEAIKDDPTQADALFAYGLTYLGSDEPARDGMIALREAWRLLPSHPSVGVHYALLQLQAGEFDAAADLASHLAALSDSEEMLKLTARIVELAGQRNAEGARVFGEQVLQRHLSADEGEG